MTCLFVYYVHLYMYDMIVIKMVGDYCADTPPLTRSYIRPET